MGIHELIGLALTTHIVFAGGRVVMTLHAIELGGSSLQVGIVLSLMAALPMLLAISGGRWVDRIGVRGPMIFGMSVVSAGVVLPLLWPSLATLYLTASLIGVGYLPFHLSTQKYVADLGTPDDRRHNFSLYTIGFSISGFLGPTLSGFLIDGIGHRLTYGVLTLISVATVTWMGWRRQSLSNQGRSPAPETASLRVWDLLRSPEMRRLYLVVVVISSAWDVHQFLIPIYGAHVGLSASAIGLILGAFAVATLVVRLMVPLFLMKVSEWRVVGVAQVIAAGVFICFPFYSTFESMLVLSFILGLGLGVSQPMMLSLISRTAPPERLGEAAGLRVMMVNATQTVLPGTFGALGNLIGISPLFWAMAVVLAAGAGDTGRFIKRTGR